MHVATSRLKFKEEELWKRFQAWLQIEGKQQFSSDDFRRYGLHGLLSDQKHGIGGFFAKLLRKGEIRKVGWTRSTIASNNMRAIRLYEINLEK